MLLEQWDRTHDLQPIFKYTGGKRRELGIIDEFIPNFSGRYIEPFVGGGALFWHIKANRYYINDLSTDIINIYKNVQSQNKLFFYYLDKIEEYRQIIIEFTSTTKFKNLSRTFRTNHNMLIRHCQKVLGEILFTDFANSYLFVFLKEIENTVTFKVRFSKSKIYDRNEKINIMATAIHSALYNTIRYIYNFDKDDDTLHTSCYYYLLSFSGLNVMRYNNQNNLSSSYTGFSLNDYNFRARIDYMKDRFVLKKIKNTRIDNMDYKDYLKKIKLNSNDFVFFDPPYDCSNIRYNNTDFTKENHKELKDLIYSLPCKWLMIIKDTNFIRELYSDYVLFNYEKIYSISKDKKRNTHLIVANF